MRLQRLAIDRLPGLRSGFVLESLSPGMNVIIGPNGSGKSSLCRAVRALLWEEEAFRGAVRSEWELDGDRVAIERESGTAPELRPLTGSPASPDLPEARFRKCFTLSVDDFLTDSDTEEEIALEIRKELAAGFDLSAILADQRGRGARSGGALQKAATLQKARREKETIRSEHQRLAQEERGLEELREELDLAAEANRSAPLHRDAVELARARLAAREAAAALDGFSSGVERLRGDEAKRLEELRAQIAECEEELHRARGEAEAARDALARCGLAQPVPPADLETLSTREQRLRARERELDRAREREATAAARLAEAGRALRRFSAGDPPPELEETSWAEIEKALAERQARAARVTALQAEVELDEAGDEGRAEPPYPDGMRALSRWLEAGAAAGQWARHGVWSTIGSGALLLLGGLLSYVFAGSTGWLLVLLGLVLLGWGGWLLRRRSDDSRAHWEREYAGLGFDSPSPWSADEVVNHLARLQRENEAFEHRRLRRTLDEERRARLARAEAELRDARTRLDELVAGCGLPLAIASLELTEIAALLVERTRAAAELADAQARRLEAQAARGRELDRAGELLAPHGEARPTDATDLQRRRESLTHREQARAGAEAELSSARTGEARAVRQLSRWRRKQRELFETLEFEDGDENTLIRLLEEYPEWARAREARDGAELVVRTHESRLEGRPELAELSVGEATRRREEIDELATRQEALTTEIARTEAEVKQARAGHELEDALAAEELALDSLEEVRRELFESAAADFLVETIAREHQSLAEPDILRRAAERFGRFTRHRYRLTPPHDTLEEGPGFEVHETDGGRKQVAQLSSGTLSQLCLALRLAVAESLERDEALPIFLDEALTNSDPVRFREVALSLGELVREGRQVFFLTADPDDARRLEEFLGELSLESPCPRFDLAELSGEQAAAESLESTPLPEVPAPLPGEEAADYGERLRVPGIDPFAGVDALHAFYLCSDDLASLHAVLTERVETVGQVSELLESHPRPVWEAAIAERFTARRSVAAAWLEAYRIGRSPALPSEVLREGPAGRTKYLGALIEINAELSGDAAALLAALEPKDRDPRLKGFRQATVLLLRADLEERGLYSPREPLDEEALLERALAAAFPHLEDSTLSREEVHQLAHALAGWLEPAAS